MKILVINAGSSSLKYQVIDMENEKVITKGLCERIGIDGRHTNKTNGGKFVEEVTMKNHSDALKVVIDCLESDTVPTISSLNEIGAIGHRVLHAGEKFKDSVVITPEILKDLEELIPLGPLHQPANISGIKACEELLPGVPQVAVFDTTFHSTMPDYAYRYAIPKEAYTKWQIRKYGFHGTSHKFIAGELEKLCGKKGNFIICHSGNGASLSAVKEGKCIDTTMGYTPLEGVMMGSRAGDIDASVCERLMKETGMTIGETINYLNKKGGVSGISGVSSDFRDLTSARAEGNKRAALAMDMFNYACKKYIGAYAAAMNGVDCIVFTAGVGENMPHIREEICGNMEYLGLWLDKEKNYQKNDGTIHDISGEGAKVKVLVIPTNEELVIARETVELL